MYEHANAFFSRSDSVFDKTEHEFGGYQGNSA
jgi:hypothetical protein